MRFKHIASYVPMACHLWLKVKPQCEKFGLVFAGDNRVAIIATLFLPVVGWVRTHMLDRMAEGAHKAMVVIKYYVDRSMLGGGMQANFVFHAYRTSSLSALQRTAEL